VAGFWIGGEVIGGAGSGWQSGVVKEVKEVVGGGGRGGMVAAGRSLGDGTGGGSACSRCAVGQARGEEGGGIGGSTGRLIEHFGMVMETVVVRLVEGAGG